MPIERMFQSNGLLIFCYEDLDLWGSTITLVIYSFLKRIIILLVL